MKYFTLRKNLFLVEYKENRNKIYINKKSKITLKYDKNIWRILYVNKK